MNQVRTIAMGRRKEKGGGIPRNPKGQDRTNGKGRVERCRNQEGGEGARSTSRNLEGGGRKEERRRMEWQVSVGRIWKCMLCYVRCLGTEVAPVMGERQ